MGMRAAHASSTDGLHLFERSGLGPRSELCGPTSLGAVSVKVVDASSFKLFMLLGAPCLVG